MKKSLFRLAASAVCLFAALLLAGFAPQKDAAKSMEQFARAALQDDVKSLKAFGVERNLAGEEAAFESGFRESVGDLFSAEQIHRLYGAWHEAFARSRVGTRLIIEAGGKALVEVTFEVIDMQQLAKKQMLAEARKDVPKNPTKEELAEWMTKTFLKALRKIETKQTMTRRIACTYDEARGVWLPDRPEEAAGLFTGIRVDRTIKEAPETSMEALAAAWLQQDAAGLIKFKLDWQDLREALLQSFERGFREDVPGQYTEEQARQASEAYLDSFAQCKVKAQPNSVKIVGEKATVELTVDRLSEVDPDKIAREMEESGISYASDEEATAEYIRRLVAHLRQRRVIGTSTLQVNCVYNPFTGVWHPKDLTEFGISLYNAADGF